MKVLKLLLCILTGLLLSGCGVTQQQLRTESAVYTIKPESSEKYTYSPTFIVQNPAAAYNRIGTPAARKTTEGHSQIVVDPATPTIYFEQGEFSTAQGIYRNLVYRVHFERVPLGITNLNLTAGNNPGILIIFTLDQEDTLLLVTAVHTCGCFLAFFPTDSLAEEFYPPTHPKEKQWIYGQTLPGRLTFATSPPSAAVVFWLESETHRISNVAVSSGGIAKNQQKIIMMTPAPMRALYQLQVDGGGTESFFEMSGPREGYVRNNTKILERLLISWWAFDWHVGEDKAYGQADTSSVPLYTSLKFWARKDSDLKDFPRFLAYWGWKL